MKKWNYYNDSDPFICAWARELIKKGLVPNGEVDCRSIADVQPDDLKGFIQCHFFCGILGWSYALRLAGWPDSRAVWTGSCPCQPLSVAGKRQGHADQRHLWPAFYRLIAECRPPVVFGEQVASKDGREWFAAVRADLEGVGYACGSAGLPACSVGAPHIRQRLWFVAESDGRHTSTEGQQRGGEHGQQPQDGVSGELADAEIGHGRTGKRRTEAGTRTDGERRRGFASGGADGELGHAEQPGLERLAGHGDDGNEPRRHGTDAAGSVAETGRTGCVDDSASPRHDGEREGAESQTWDKARLCGPERGCFWSSCDWLPCRDGKARPTQCGIFPLVDGLSRDVVPSGDPSESYAQATSEARVGRLRGYGNSIVPQVAAEFITAYCEVAHAD